VTSTRALRRGDLVEVRAPADIIVTLDATGALDGLPFMPEMADLCGQRFVVGERADKICDPYHSHSRRMPDTVLLEAPRCDGSGHEGCDAGCRMLWKQAWLKRVDTHAPPAAGDPADAERLSELVAGNIRRDTGGDTIYRCQATAVNEASSMLTVKDPRPYVRELTNGNVSLRRFARVMPHAVSVEVKRKTGRLSYPFVKGTSEKSPAYPPLGLQPGDWVRVKSREEIEGTLTVAGKHRGLSFGIGMLPYCGRVMRVQHVVRRLIDEQTGRMLDMKSDCLILEGAFCSGDLSVGRWFCPRHAYQYFRECWLEPVAGPAP
jgi:hypothetical protein